MKIKKSHVWIALILGLLIVSLWIYQEHNILYGLLYGIIGFIFTIFALRIMPYYNKVLRKLWNPMNV